MVSGVASAVSILLLGASRVAAEYTNFQWTNTSKPNCPNSGGECIPPAICARNDPSKVWFCCVPGNKDEVCHTVAAGCDGGGKGIPSGAQQTCSSGNNAFCCLKDSQSCTQQWGQINICWGTIPNPVALLDDVQMNNTYKSLVAAKPSAASYPISFADIQSLTTSTPTPSSSTAASSNSASTTPSASSATSTPSSASEPSSGSSGLSGGAIGGIVGGVVGGLALIGAVAFLLWRRKKYSTIAQADPSSPTNGHGPPGEYQPGNGYQQGNGYQTGAAEVHGHNMSNVPPTEKYANTGYTPEMPAYQQPVEMSAQRY